MFEHVLDNDNFNYQVYRVLFFGKKGCKREEILEAMKGVWHTESWYKQWQLIAEQAREDGRYLHSMYYYRMAEFMLLPNRPEKDDAYEAMQAMFHKAFPNVKKEKIPYKDSYLTSVHLLSPNATQTLVIHGGFDSFTEEFYLIAEQLADADVTIILFEGEGLGEPLRQGLYFNEKWEQSVKAVLDHYLLDEVILMGISWGGYFALRAAAYEKRIKHVIFHGVLYDGLGVQQHLLRQPIRAIFNLLYRLKFKKTINLLAHKKMKSDQLTNWGVTHGMYITHTESPFEFFSAIEKHNLRRELKRIDQNVLLLTEEKDHYIPRWQL